MILLTLKCVPYITIKNAISLAENKDKIHCVHTQALTLMVLLFYIFSYTYLLPFLHFASSDDSKGVNAQ